MLISANTVNPNNLQLLSMNRLNQKTDYSCFKADSRDLFIRKEKEVSFRGKLNIFSSFKPNSAFKKLCFDKSLVFSNLSEDIKISEVSLPIMIENVEKLSIADVIASFNNNGSKNIIIKYNDRVLGFMEFKKLKVSDYDGFSADKSDIIILRVLNSFSKNVGSELIGILIREAINSGCEGKINLTASSPSVPVGFYFLKGFLPKMETKYNSSYGEIIKNIEEALEKKGKNEISLQDCKELLKKYNGIEMYLPKESVNEWEKQLNPETIKIIKNF